jgi:ABC-type transporter Mla subunit MlaD
MGLLIHGDLIVRSLYDAMERRAQQAETQAERNTDAVERLTGVVEKLAAVSDERDRALDRALNEINEGVDSLARPQRRGAR